MKYVERCLPRRPNIPYCKTPQYGQGTSGFTKDGVHERNMKLYCSRNNTRDEKTRGETFAPPFKYVKVANYLSKYPKWCGISTKMAERTNDA